MYEMIYRVCMRSYQKANTVIGLFMKQQAKQRSEE